MDQAELCFQKTTFAEMGWSTPMAKSKMLTLQSIASTMGSIGLKRLIRTISKPRFGSICLRVLTRHLIGRSASTSNVEFVRLRILVFDSLNLVTSHNQGILPVHRNSLNELILTKPLYSGFYFWEFLYIKHKLSIGPVNVFQTIQIIDYTPHFSHI